MACMLSCILQREDDCVDGEDDGPVKVYVKVSQTNEIIYPQIHFQKKKIKVETLQKPKTWTKLKSNINIGSFQLRYHYCGKDYYMSRTSKGEKWLFILHNRNCFFFLCPKPSCKLAESCFYFGCLKCSFHFLLIDKQHFEF